MAQGAVGARTEGDVFQGLFFWSQAAELLRDNSKVRRVDLEHDEAAGVDDVAVFYDPPGVDAGGWHADADYFQLKYHVDNRNCYSSEGLIDPAFISAKASLLQRFHDAYRRLSSDSDRFRLSLASNWRWQRDDKLAAVLREFDGALPNRFHTDGPGSHFGKIRESWRAHLALDENEFAKFARTLRFQLDHFGRRDFRRLVMATLAAAGLKPPDADRAACPYESLVQQFLMNGPNSFDRTSLRTICAREGLLLDADESPSKSRKVLGVRSFVRFAERLDDEVDEIVCVAKNFEGRHPKSHESWPLSATSVNRFFSDADRIARLRSEAHGIALECHGTLAFLSGYELSRNSGVTTFPLQKPSRNLWKPQPSLSSEMAAWSESVVASDSSASDIAVCLSVTHEISGDVIAYLNTPDGPSVRMILVLTPVDGPGPSSIRGPDHAWLMADQFPALLARHRPSKVARVHLFFAGPNSLAYFVGQLREALGRMTLYEYDFGLEREGMYHPSIVLPPVNMNYIPPQERSE